MAVLKCKMCGGDIEVSQDKTFGTCDSCGSTMTFPKIDDEQRANMFNRGNHFRRMGEFDKALAVYERILQEDDTDAEAHWCCVLCRFGIEYVEDPSTFEFLPTCHRASFESILEDVDYLAAIEHSDGITRRQYQKEVVKISEVQKGILATSQNEEPFDVFICYKESEDDGTRTHDSTYAQDIYYQLTEQGWRVFFSRITLEDKAGTEYEPYIFAALNSAKVMIMVTTSEEHANAVWVKNEWSRFLALMRKDRSKLLIPCYRDMDPYDLPEALSVLQSYDMSKIGFVQDLIRGINKVLESGKEKVAAKENVVVQQVSSGADTQNLLRRGYLSLEDKDWEKAKELFDNVLNIDAENAEAYLGMMLAEKQYEDKDAFSSDYILEKTGGDRRFERAKQFASKELNTWFENLEIQRKEERIRQKEERQRKQIEEKRKQEEERLRLEEEQKRIRQEQVHAEQKADAVAAAIEKHFSQSKEISLQDQQMKLEKKYEELKQLRKLLPEYLEQTNSNEEELNATRNTIDELQTSRQSLGLFARKEKTAIDDQLRQVNSKLNNLIEKQVNIRKKMCGYSTVVQIEKDITKLTEQIEQLKSKIQKEDSNYVMSYEEALKCVKNATIRAAVKKIKPGLRNKVCLGEKGDVIKFGNYHGEIEWIVLEREQNKLFLISLYGLDAAEYNKKYMDTTWSICTLRQWLNKIFLAEAFSEAEQKQISWTNVTTGLNPYRMNSSVEDTMDKVFLLSVQEVNSYFTSDIDRRCAPTNYAITKGAFVMNNVKTSAGKAACSWWLRSSGDFSGNAAYVSFTGGVNSTGAGVNLKGDCVRPALWINLEIQ